MRESDILYQAGSYWVSQSRHGHPKYTVWKDGPTHATAKGSFALNADGLSLAITYAAYLHSQEPRS